MIEKFADTRRMLRSEFLDLITLQSFLCPF